MFIYNTVENISIEQLHNTFLDAFSDYQVKMNFPLINFQRMLMRNGYVKEASMGAFEENALVGFILNAVRQIVVDRNFRGKGIGKSIFIDLLNSTESNNIKVLNVDSQSVVMKKFLMNLGFNMNVKQYEMALKLHY